MTDPELAADMKALCVRHGHDGATLAAALAGALAAALADAPASYRMAIAESYFEEIRAILRASLQ